MTGNRDLAQRARQLAAAAPSGSFERPRPWGRSIVTVEWRDHRFRVTIQGPRRIKRFSLSLDEAEDLVEELGEQIACPRAPEPPAGGRRVA